MSKFDFETQSLLFSKSTKRGLVKLTKTLKLFSIGFFVVVALVIAFVLVAVFAFPEVFADHDVLPVIQNPAYQPPTSSAPDGQGG